MKLKKLVDKFKVQILVPINFGNWLQFGRQVDISTFSWFGDIRNWYGIW